MNILLFSKLDLVNVIRPSLREEAPPKSISFCHHAPEKLARWQ